MGFSFTAHRRVKSPSATALVTSTSSFIGLVMPRVSQNEAPMVNAKNASPPRSVITISGQFKAPDAPATALLSAEELVTLARVAVSLGIGKIRITGGDFRRRFASPIDIAALFLGALARGERACLEPEGAMEQEQVFAEYMRNAQTFRLADGQLQIFGADGEALTFVPRE